MARKRKYPTNAARQAAYRQRRRRSRKAGLVMALIRSSQRDDWETPQAFYHELDAEFHFDLDAAASVRNAKCSRYFTQEDNALEQDWSGRVFLNPPYGPKLSAAFVGKASEQRNNCEVIVVLIPARTSTKWWRTYVWHDGAPAPGVTLRFPPRLRNDRSNQIGKSERRWPFPSALIILRPDHCSQDRSLPISA